jgi:GNAT superfamily N-acetyltransferase
LNAGEPDKADDRSPLFDAAMVLRETVCPSDVEMVRRLTVATGFFLPMEVEVAVELVKERLEKEAASGYHFLFWDQGGRPAAYTCFGPIPCTQSSYDLYWIAVHPDFQQKGIGQRLMQAAEAHIRRSGGTQVYVETSQRPLYESTRNFYQKCGYATAAVMPDFYGPGDGKIVLCKKLELLEP